MNLNLLRREKRRTLRVEAGCALIGSPAYLGANSYAQRTGRRFASLLAATCFVVIASCGSNGGGAGAGDEGTTPRMEPVGRGTGGSTRGGPAKTPAPGTAGLVLESHSLGDVRESGSGVKPPFPDAKLRARCEAVYQLAFPDSSSPSSANPFRLASKADSWAEALDAAAVAREVKPTAFKTLYANVRVDNGPKISLECAFPVRAQGVNSAAGIYAPPGATFGLDTGYPFGIERHVLGGLVWERTTTIVPGFRDEISLQWLIEPIEQKADHGFFALETRSEFSDLAEGCIARALQFAADESFQSSSMWAIARADACPSKRFFSLTDKAPPPDVPPARRADGTIDPASARVWDDSGVLRPERMVPFDPTGARTFVCETPYEAAQCGLALVRDITPVLAQTVAKDAPLYVRFASKTKAGRVLITSGSISPEGKITFLEARSAREADAIARVLP